MPSDAPYWPEGLDTPLIGRRHEILPRSQVTRMESGRQRIRRMQLESLETMEVTWNFVAESYATFREFFINQLQHGSLFFVMETLEANPEPHFQWLVTRYCAFLDGTYTLSRSDNLYVVEAVLEVDSETQDYYPAKHLRAVVADGGTAEATFLDGEITHPPESVVNGGEFFGGDYLLAIYPPPDQEDLGSNEGAFLSGSYESASTEADESETGDNSGTFLWGAYTPNITTAPLPETVSNAGTMQSGIYRLTAILVPEQNEAGNSSGTFLSGAYTLV